MTFGDFAKPCSQPDSAKTVNGNKVSHKLSVWYFINDNGKFKYLFENEKQIPWPSISFNKSSNPYIIKACFEKHTILP